ncbi:MAG: anti-sigma factor [Allorhizobium sp.]
MSSNPTPEERAERADIYVLGLLEASEAGAFEAELETDAALRAAVGKSRDRFVELDLVGPAHSLSPDIWSRIDASLDRGTGDTQGAAPVAAARVAPVRAVANDNRLRRWRATALSGMAACLLLIAGLSYALLHQPQPQVIAVLLDSGGNPLVLVEDFGNAEARITPIADFSVPADRSMQVWTLPSKDMGPQSLGLLDGWNTMLLQRDGLPKPHEDQLYEITLEQPGGSPTGRPTGPILVKGFAKVPR